MRCLCSALDCEVLWLAASSPCVLTLNFLAMLDCNLYLWLNKFFLPYFFCQSNLSHQRELKIRDLSKLLLHGFMSAHNHQLSINASSPRMSFQWFRLQWPGLELYMPTVLDFSCWKARNSDPKSCVSREPSGKLVKTQSLLKVSLQEVWNGAPPPISFSNESQTELRQPVPRWPRQMHTPASFQPLPSLSPQKQWPHRCSKSLTLRQSLGSQNHLRSKTNSSRIKGGYPMEKKPLFPGAFLLSCFALVFFLPHSQIIAIFQYECYRKEYSGLGI